VGEPCPPWWRSCERKDACTQNCIRYSSANEPHQRAISQDGELLEKLEVEDEERRLEEQEGERRKHGNQVTRLE
jgi:hypothetical protein